MYRVKNVWKPAPLPLPFHLALDGGDWVQALKAYHAHPFHAPPLDTYDLLKTIFYHTKLNPDIIKQKFETKVRTSLQEKRTYEQVDWATYWESLNKGDSQTICNALHGAKINSSEHQVGIACACAVLLKSEGRSWQKHLIDNTPFASVTTNNLVTIALERGRWDLAVEIMRNARLGRGDVANLWPLLPRFNWAVGLLFVTACSRSAVSFNVVLPQLLENGCELHVLAEHMEKAKLINDENVVQPLLEHAVEHNDYVFAEKCYDHLVDLDAVSPAAHRILKHQFNQFGHNAVFKALKQAEIPLAEVAVEDLEVLRFGK